MSCKSGLNIFLIFLLLSMDLNLIKNKSILFTKSLRLFQDAFLVNFDSYYVDHFRKTSNHSDVYEFYVKRNVRKFYVDTSIRSHSKNKEIYKMTDMDGCVFLGNPLMNRLFYNFYRNLLVNATLFTCPIKKGQYYLRTLVLKNGIPPIHPKGNFTFNVCIKNMTSDAGIILNFSWIYHVMKG